MSGAVEGVALLPCPFCGGEGEAVCLRAGEDSVLSWVRCLLCHAKTDEIEDAYSDLPTARSSWNTRTTPPARSYADGVRATDMVTRWHLEYLATPGVHWGDAIAWNSAFSIAAKIDAERPVLSKGEKA